MAHSPQYWYDYMQNEKNGTASLSALQPAIDNTQTLLSDLTSPTSRVAKWRLFFWIVATAAWAVEVSMDGIVVLLELLASRSRFGTKPWYVNHALEFQYGDTLVYQDKEYKYPVIDLTKQIIKRAACEENGNIINLKIATLTGGVPAPLSAPQLAAFSAYMEESKPAGADINIINSLPDELRLYVKVMYDPLVIDNTGQVILAPGTYPAIDAINEYISNLNVSNFNGTLELCDQVDKIRSATGMKAAYIISASARYGANPFIAFTERYKANAGHLVIDPTSPLSATITYEAINV